MITLLGKLKANMCFEYKAIIKWVNTVKKKKSVFIKFRNARMTRHFKTLITYKFRKDKRKHCLPTRGGQFMELSIPAIR